MERRAARTDDDSLCVDEPRHRVFALESTQSNGPQAGQHATSHAVAQQHRLRHDLLQHDCNPHPQTTTATTDISDSSNKHDGDIADITLSHSD